ncbi:MAG: hypothetical protein WC856_01075 [Methylococcaceae bacterium]|jgi:hypothetical protein
MVILEIIAPYIHWQIAAALYILMGIMTGYGLPNVEETMGKGLVCFSTFLIFLLHVTTYYYFKELQYIKKEELKKIIEGIKKINGSFRFLEENNNKKICKFWSIHPEFGFVIIFFALFCLGVAS